jgi:hypothetical protein
MTRSVVGARATVAATARPARVLPRKRLPMLLV